MIKDITLINTVINKIQANSKADLIRKALISEINSVPVEKDFLKRQEASRKRFQEAKEKFEQEQKIFQESEKANSLIVLEKRIKKIFETIENVGL